MSQNLAVSDQDKKRISNLLADKLIYGYEQRELLNDTGADAADYILTNFKLVKTRAQLLEFLQFLSSKWPVFMSVYQDEKKKDLIGQIEVELNQITHQ